MHCISIYPPEIDTIQLNNILGLRDQFPDYPIGFSDHTLGIEVSLAATALGAKVIEKHFTLDKSLPGPDHKASLEPCELKRMVSGIRNISLSLGNGEKKPSKSELKRRLIKRGRESSKEINLRLSYAIKEMKHYNEYKYVLINEKVQKTVSEIKKIIEYNQLIMNQKNNLKKQLKRIINC